MKTLRKGIVLALLSIGIYVFLDVSFMSNNIFNMITVNTVLVGFLFTILTILMPFADEDVILTYEKTNELEQIYSNITTGIVLGILSIAISIIILCIWGEPKTTDITSANKIMYSIIIGMFMIIMKSMFLAILDINNILKAIRRRKIMNKKEEEANKEMEAIYRSKSKCKDKMNSNKEA
jgi:hypothetical protein